jgi:predicted RNA-binding protein Jag
LGASQLTTEGGSATSSFHLVKTTVDEAIEKRRAILDLRSDKSSIQSIERPAVAVPSFAKKNLTPAIAGAMAADTAAATIRPMEVLRWRGTAYIALSDERKFRQTVITSTRSSPCSACR